MGTEAWRIPLGESGVMEFFYGIVPTVESTGLKLNCLKIAGNSCAEEGSILLPHNWWGWS